MLSPKRLGPPAQFAPVPVEAKSDSGDRAQPATKPLAEHPIAVPTTRLRAERRLPPARAKLARRPGNPLDAQARDARVQTWPCKTGGSCNWQ